MKTEEALLKIARKELRLDSFDILSTDALFNRVYSVLEIKKALFEAYKAGRESVSLEKRDTSKDFIKKL